MNETDLLSTLKPISLAVAKVGSKVTCNPPPENTDKDYLVLLHWDYIETSLLEEYLSSSGFLYEGDQSYKDCAEDYNTELAFRSYRKGDVNLIVTFSKIFYEKFLAATLLAKKLNLMEKQQRVDLFQTFLYDTLNCQGAVSDFEEIELYRITNYE